MQPLWVVLEHADCLVAWPAEESPQQAGLVTVIDGKPCLELSRPLSTDGARFALLGKDVQVLDERDSEVLA